MVDAGTQAPAFELQNQDGKTVSLSDVDDDYVVVYFYPKADTSECTTEAKQFRDAWEDFEDEGVTVVGISTDPPEEVSAFHEKYDLPFDLLSDADGEVAQRYDTYLTMETDDGTYEYATRETFVVGPDRTVEAHFEDVSLEDNHARTVLDRVAE